MTQNTVPEFSVRHLFKDVFTYGFGDVLLRATGLITLPIYTRVFAPEQYGIWGFLQTVIALLSAFLLFGGESTYARFFFQAKTDEDRRKVTSTWLLFLGGWTTLITVFLAVIADNLSAFSFGSAQYADLYRVAVWLLPVAAINQTMGSALRNQFRAKLFSAFNIITSVLVIGFSLLLVLYFDWGLGGIFWGALLGNLAVLPFRMWFIRNLIRPLFSCSCLKEMLAYGTPLMPTAIAYWVFTSSDRFLLEKLSTRAELGLYSVAVVGVSALQFVNAAVGQAWSPHAVKLYEEQPEQAPVMYGRVLTYLLGLFACLAVGLASFAREALMMLSTPPYIPAAAAVGPLALSIIASASSQVTAAGISLKKRTSFLLLYSWAAALLNVGFNILLIPQWGMLGASWATAASYIFLTLSCLYTSQRLWPIVIETRRTVSIVVSTVLFITALGFMPELPLLPSLGLKAGFCLSFGLVLFAVGAFHWAELRSTFFLFKARTGQNRV